MFDDNNKQPEDMFSGVDKEADSGVKKPEGTVTKAPMSSTVQLPAAPGVAPRGASFPEMPGLSPASGSRGFLKAIIIGLVVLVVLVAAAFGGWMVYSKLTSQASNANTVNTNNEADLNENEFNANAPVINTNINFENPVTQDSDGDGLTDERESILGTNPELVDSDSDGLTDKEEVDIYKTNPLVADTDGDSYDDGNEVRHGYDPLISGSARLYPVNQVQ